MLAISYCFLNLSQRSYQGCDSLDPREWGLGRSLSVVLVVLIVSGFFPFLVLPVIVVLRCRCLLHFNVLLSPLSSKKMLKAGSWWRTKVLRSSLLLLRRL